MIQTTANQLTAQFYNWEERGRGWHVFEEPVQLEPDFVPFFFHGLPAQPGGIIDDGRHHTMLSSLFSEARKLFNPKPKQTAPTQPESTIAAYAHETLPPPVCFSLSFPKGQKVGGSETEQVLLMFANCQYPISFEIVATGESIRVQYTCAYPDASFLFSQLKAYFPTCTLTEIEDAILPIVDYEMQILDFGLREEFMRPLAMLGGFDPDPLISLFGILEHIRPGDGGAVQVLFIGCDNPWAESILRAVSDGEGGAFFADAPDMLPLAKQKVSAPLFAVCIRAIGMSEDVERAKDILWNIAHAIVHQSRATGNQLLPLSNDEYPYGNHLADILYRQSHRLGMLLNSRELATFTHYPSASVASTKLERDTKKTKAAPESAIGHKLILGINEHQGNVTAVSQSEDQRIKHTHVIGATGTGKSTLLLNMIVQDIEQHNGLCVLDPHGDLIEKILTHISAERAHDVLLIDPADAEHPVSFNILSAHSEIEKDILSSDLVAAFRRLSTSWGDQMNSVFANAILAFLESSKGGTLADLRRFLVDKSFQHTFLKTVSDPSIVYYWHREYPLLKSGSIGSILTRLDAFLRPKIIRNMVCQHKSIDFEKLMQERKIILVKLSQGLIGAENSYLLGTFIVSKLQQVAMARQAISQAERTNFYLYIDEFQHFITPSMHAILSGARKYHLGLILAHQSMQQVADTEIAASIIANAGTRVCFRLGETDAKKLEAGFSFFEAKDLQNLATGEAIARIERPEHDFSLTTQPVSVPTQPKEIQEQVIAHSRVRYSTPRKEVEEMLAESMQVIVEEPAQKLVKEHKQVPTAPKEESAPSSAQEVTRITVPPKQQPQSKEITDTPAAQAFNKREAARLHTMLKNRIKRMAEDRGYRASLEYATPDGKGFVDVLLEKNGTTIAVEVSVTTSAAWELHNVRKCLMAAFPTIIVCTEEKKHIENIRATLIQHLTDQEQQKVFVFDPDALFQYIDSLFVAVVQQERKVKGWTVTTERKILSQEEMDARGSTYKKLKQKPPERE